MSSRETVMNFTKECLFPSLRMRTPARAEPSSGSGYTIRTRNCWSKGYPEYSFLIGPYSCELPSWKNIIKKIIRHDVVMKATQIFCVARNKAYAIKTIRAWRSRGTMTLPRLKLGLGTGYRPYGRAASSVDCRIQRRIQPRYNNSWKKESSSVSA